MLVTGANGFVGRHLTSGAITRGLESPARSTDGVYRPPTMKSAIGSIGPSTDWSDAVAGAQAVVHLAARVHHVNEEGAIDLYRTINTEGTLQLARAAATAGVKRFIFVSTMLVNGSCTDGRAPFREKRCLSPRGWTTDFRRQKRSFGLARLSARDVADAESRS